MSINYIAIETNIERFDKYKALWNKIGINGIMAITMTEGIKTALEIEKSKTEELYFVSIAADDVPNFLEHLNDLDNATSAPILVATSNYTEREHHEALNRGADFYAHFCKDSEQDINGVVSAINSLQRPRKQKMPIIMSYGKVSISIPKHSAYINDVNLKLTRQEFDILHLLMKNYGIVLTYKKIYRHVWGGEYEDSARDMLWNAIMRLRKKMEIVPNGPEYISNILDVGYRFSIETDT